MTSIFEHLRHDHDLLGQILRRIRSGHGDPAGQLQLFRREFTAHVKAEENVFYSYLIHDPSLRNRAIEFLADHARIEERLGAAEAALADPERLGPKIDALSAELRQHGHEVETHVFLRARRVLPERAAAALGVRFVEERARIHRDISALDGGLAGAGAH
jgi:hypothetical protein